MPSNKRPVARRREIDRRGHAVAGVETEVDVRRGDARRGDRPGDDADRGGRRRLHGAGELHHDGEQAPLAAAAGAGEAPVPRRSAGSSVHAAGAARRAAASGRAARSGRPARAAFASSAAGAGRASRAGRPPGSAAARAGDRSAGATGATGAGAGATRAGPPRARSAGAGCCCLPCQCRPFRYPVVPPVPPFMISL